MISIVCVYNNKQALDEILLPSLKRQTVKYELIALDNTGGKFKSAAQAFNYGGTQAHGKYIMFVHQDIELGSNSWLDNVEKIMDDIVDLGIAGVAGMSDKKNLRTRERGYISDCGKIWKGPGILKKPVEVQTLDECLLIVKRSVFSQHRFDEKRFDGWHCYGADYCLSIREQGLKVYVIPAFVYHRSLRANRTGLLKYQQRLWKKHRKNYDRIYTTVGEISGLKLQIQKYVEIISPLYRRIVPRWTEYLKRELAGCTTLLDLGCGYNSPVQYCRIPFSTGVEQHEPHLIESKKKRIHNKYIQANIMEFDTEPDTFDVVLSSEVIRNFQRQERVELIKKMEKWAKKKVIILISNVTDGSGCLNILKELRDSGFKLYGLNGWRYLRGGDGAVKFKPAILWNLISDLTQMITYHHPEFASQILAVKKIEPRQFNPAYITARDDILKLIPGTVRRVLDFGCAVGALGERLKKCYRAEVVGIELDEQMAEVAREKLDRVITGNINDIDFSEHFQRGYFDCLIFGDILEHLEDPWKILENAINYLSDQGIVIASIPNVRHFSIILNLALRGQWKYRDRGIQDKTHLRFFTLKSIREMFYRADLKIVRIERNYNPGIFNRISRYLPVLPFREFLTFQYLVLAKKND